MKNSIESNTRLLAEHLLARHLRISTAESCTGGLVAKTFTDLAGSSDWFDRGFVTYSNQAKIDMLGVSDQTLQEHGAVSEETASEMVVGALQHSEAGVAIAVTGIAGPGGGTPSKPVGTVCFGFALGEEVWTEKMYFNGDRQQVRQQSLEFVLQRLLGLLMP